MKLSELPLDLAKSGDTLIVVNAEGESQRVTLSSLIDYIGTDADFVTAFTKNSFFQNHLRKELLQLLASAGLDTVAETNLASEGGFVSNNGYIAPGQQLKNPEAEIELTGTVKVD